MNKARFNFSKKKLLLKKTRVENWYQIEAQKEVLPRSIVSSNECNSEGN